MEEQSAISPSENLSSSKSLKKKKSVTRLLTASLSRKSSFRSKSFPSSFDQAPPTPILPFDCRPTTPKMPDAPRIPTMTFDAFRKTTIFSDQIRRDIASEVDGSSKPSMDPNREAMQSLDANSKILIERKSYVGYEDFSKAKATSRSRSVVERAQRSDQSPIQYGSIKSTSELKVKTGLRKPSSLASIHQNHQSLTPSPSVIGKAAPTPAFRSSTASGYNVSRPTGKRKPGGKLVGQDCMALPPAVDVEDPQIQRRPQTTSFSAMEARSSFKSTLTGTSSNPYTPSTTRSSVLTRETSLGDDLMAEAPLRPISKSGSMTVDDAIDMYAEGFSDDIELGPPESKDLSTSEEGQEKSMKLAEAVNETTGKTSNLQLVSQNMLESVYVEGSDGIMRLLPPPILPPTSSHDLYGFLKTNRHVNSEHYQAWSGPYWQSQQRRKRKWLSYMHTYGLSTQFPLRFPKRSEKTERFVRKGIPCEWRGQAWFFYAGGQAYLARHPRLYASLLRRCELELSSTDQEAIERDLHRTFPDNVHFKPVTPDTKEIPILNSLRRVLRAFALHSPKIGYCQSLNFIAGLLLLFLPEEKAFWMLHIITTVYLPGTHETSLEGANIDLWVLMMALKSTMPSIWERIGASGTPGDELVGNAQLPPISICTTSWFMSLFVGTLPIETVLRVWDCLFYEGIRVLFRVALSIFKLGEQRINSVQDAMELFQVVQALPKDILDAGLLIRMITKRGGIGSDWVELKRWERKEWYAKAKVSHDPGAGDYFGAQSDERGPKVKRRDSLWRRRKRKGSAPDLAKSEKAQASIPPPASALSLA